MRDPAILLPRRRPPLRYLALYLDRVTAPIVSLVIALAIIGLRSVVWG